MKWFLCVLVAAACSAMFPFLIPGPPAETTADFTRHLDERIPKLMRLYDIAGANIALVRDAKVVWTGAYGFADREENRILATETPMRAQSISKSVTAWGIMRLVEQGRLALDAPVSEYLTASEPLDLGSLTNAVTIRQLLSHTGGLPLGDVFTIYAPGEPMPSLEEKLAGDIGLAHAPGSRFAYSNTGYHLLEWLIEKQTGLGFSDFMEREIFAPLGMKHSTFDADPRLAVNWPVGYTLRGRPVPPYVYPEKASGGLITTAADIAAFAIAGMKDAPSGRQSLHTARGVLQSASIDAMHAPASRSLGLYGLVFDAYGLGHFIESLSDGTVAVAHGGQGTGNMTHFHAVPETGDAIVILTNSQRSWPFIAFLLRDWARWCGFPPLGMERILWASLALWALVGLLWAAFLKRLSAMTTVRAHPLPKNVHVARAVAPFLLLLWLLWVASRPYVFLAAVFPRASAWLWVAALACCVVDLVLVLLNYRKGGSDATFFHRFCRRIDSGRLWYTIREVMKF